MNQSGMTEKNKSLLLRGNLDDSTAVDQNSSQNKDTERRDTNFHTAEKAVAQYQAKLQEYLSLILVKYQLVSPNSKLDINEQIMTFTQALDQVAIQKSNIQELQRKIDIITKETEINRNLLIKKYTTDLEDLNVKYIQAVAEL